MEWVHYLDRSFCAEHFRMAKEQQTFVKQVILVPRTADQDRGSTTGDLLYVQEVCEDAAVIVYPSFCGARTRSRDVFGESLVRSLKIANGLRPKASRRTRSSVCLMLPKQVLKSGKLDGDFAKCGDADWTWDSDPRHD